MRAVATITLTQDDFGDDDVSCTIECEPPMPVDVPRGQLVGVHRVIAKFVEAMKGSIEPGSVRMEK